MTTLTKQQLDELQGLFNEWDSGGWSPESDSVFFEPLSRAVPALLQAARERLELQEQNAKLREALDDCALAIQALDLKVEMEWGDCRTSEQMEAAKAWSEEVYWAREALNQGKEPA